MLPAAVRIVEVGPRDGLQNEAVAVSTEDRITLVQRLAAAGLRTIEAGSFVSPRWVPQMADTDAVMAGLKRREGVTYAALTPNLKGLERALEAGADEVEVFAAATEDFSRKNLNCSIAESLQRFGAVIDAARAAGVAVRGSVSCALGCPCQGEVSPAQVRAVALQLKALGCPELVRADPSGVGTAGSVKRLLDEVLPSVGDDGFGLHFHDTYGQGLSNIYAAMHYGVSVFDSSIAGLGGCPYARGASGNVATEDLVYLLDGLGIAHGIDRDALVATGAWISSRLGRPIQSRAGLALHQRQDS